MNTNFNLANPTYRAYQLTVPAAARNILALIQIIEPWFAGADPKELSFQADPTSPGSVYIGDNLITTTRYGYIIQPGGARVYRSSTGSFDLPLSMMWCLGSAGGSLLNVEILS